MSILCKTKINLQCVSISVGYLCRLNYTLFPLLAVSGVELSAVSTTHRFQSSRVTRRFLYTRFPPLSLLHADSVTHRLELLAFNAQKLRGHVTLATPPFRKNFSGVMSGLSLGASVPNLKFVSSTVLKRLAFNTPNFTGSRDPGHAPFYPLLTFGGWRPPSDIV